MKTYIFRHSLLGAILGLSILGCIKGDKFDYNKNMAFVTGTETTPATKFVVEDTPPSYTVAASTTNKVDKNVNVKSVIDRSLVEAYNNEHNTKYYATPEGAVTFEDADAVIQTSKASSTPATVKVISTEDFAEGWVYVAPTTMVEVDGLETLKPSKIIFPQISRVIHFISLNISNTNLYSNSTFSDNKKQELSNFTYEIKCYPQEWRCIAYLRSFTSADEQRSSTLRFGENGLDINVLQWVSPSGSIVSSTRFSTDRWYMISLTYDGGKLTMCAGGVKDAQGDGDGKPVDFRRFELGMSWTGYRGSQYFHGRIAGIRVWDRALSTGELQMNLRGVGSQSEGLVAHWKMSEGEGYTLKDATGHGYDMDWTNTTCEINEGVGLTYNPNYSGAIAWNSDDSSRCNE